MTADVRKPRKDAQQADRSRRKRPRQTCPVDPDCDWTADEDDHHAVFEHMREHLR